MSNYKYEYKDLTKEGYIKIKLTPDEHENIFRSYTKRAKYEVYENKFYFIRRRYTPLWIKIICVVSFPIAVLVHGLASIKEIIGEISDLFHEKQRGCFVEDFRIKDELKQRNIKFVEHFESEG